MYSQGSMQTTGQGVPPRQKTRGLRNIGVHFYCCSPINGLWLRTCVLIMIKLKFFYLFTFEKGSHFKNESKAIHYHYDFIIVCTP